MLGIQSNHPITTLTYKRKREESRVRGIAIEALSTPKQFMHLLSLRIPYREWAPRLNVDQLHMVFRLLSIQGKAELLENVTLTTMQEVLDVSDGSTRPLELAVTAYLSVNFKGKYSNYSEEQIRGLIPFLNEEELGKLFLRVSDPSIYLNELPPLIVGKKFAALPDEKKAKLLPRLSHAHVMELAKYTPPEHVLNVIKYLPKKHLKTFLTGYDEDKFSLIAEYLSFNPFDIEGRSEWPANEIAIYLFYEETADQIVKIFDQFTPRQIKRVAFLLNGIQVVKILNSMVSSKQTLLFQFADPIALKEAFIEIDKIREKNKPKYVELHSVLKKLEDEFLRIKKLIEEGQEHSQEAVLQFEKSYYAALQLKRNLESNLFFLLEMSKKYDLIKRRHYLKEESNLKTLTEKFQTISPFILKEMIVKKPSLKRKSEAIFIPNQTHIANLRNVYEILRDTVLSLGITSKQLDKAHISWEDLLEHDLKKPEDFNKHQIKSIEDLVKYLKRCEVSSKVAKS